MAAPVSTSMLKGVPFTIISAVIGYSHLDPSSDLSSTTPTPCTYRVVSTDESTTNSPELLTPLNDKPSLGALLMVMVTDVILKTAAMS